MKRLPSITAVSLLTMCSLMGCGQPEDAQPKDATSDVIGGGEVDLTSDADSEAWDAQELARFNAMDPNTEVVSPGGRVLRRCIAHVAEGEVVLPDGRIKDREGAIRSGPDCSAAPAAPNAFASNLTKANEGWVASSWWSPSFHPTRIVSKYTVPPNPKKVSGQTVFFFSSLQNDHWIVQPVLQFGSSSWAGGGNYWSIVSAAVPVDSVDKNRRFTSTPIRVYPGDVIIGDVSETTCFSNGHCLWKIVTRNTTRGKSTVFAIELVEPMDNAQGGVLESYGITSCDQYPPSKKMTFSSISVFDSGNQWQRAAWTPSINLYHPNCLFQMSMTNLTQPGTTTITWK